MRDFFWQRMENHRGDLTDVVRPSGGVDEIAVDLLDADWQLRSEPVNSSLMPPTSDALMGSGDQLINEFQASSFFEGQEPIAGRTRIGLQSSGDGGSALVAQKMFSEDTPRPCNSFSRVAQISPGDGKPPLLPLRAIKPPPMMEVSAGCFLDHGGMQISASRPPVIKRRKGQAKKVICIPAPAAASSRPSGEVVPSDLWAWRKYGQKPIKGSPYPRGYYRCSSSKGCSARKQVERSRTDPNMFVITYTSEHNHPWPTQRNALAGSTRIQPSKSAASAKKNSIDGQKQPTSSKGEPKDTSSSSSTAPLVKEEVMGASDDQELDQMFRHSYGSMMPECDRQDDFFADLAELETDPMNLIFPNGLTGGDDIDEERERENKIVDPFNMFDWCGNSLGDARRGLL